jgi:hypothetical protein
VALHLAHGLPLLAVLKAIAEEGQKGQKVTVIASIHQPSSQVDDGRWVQW